MEKIVINKIFETFHRLPNISKETKETLEKHVKKKLGQFGYLILKA